MAREKHVQNIIDDAEEKRAGIDIFSARSYRIDWISTRFSCVERAEPASAEAARGLQPQPTVRNRQSTMGNRVLPPALLDVAWGYAPVIICLYHFLGLGSLLCFVLLASQVHSAFALHNASESKPNPERQPTSNHTSGYA